MTQHLADLKFLNVECFGTAGFVGTWLGYMNKKYKIIKKHYVKNVHMCKPTDDQP